jgi:predicted nucleic-acid-binding protein
MVENVWVPDRAYRLAGNEISTASSACFRPMGSLAKASTGVSARDCAKEGQGWFGDALIASLDKRAGCSPTLTFNQKAKPLPGVEFRRRICPPTQILKQIP